MATPTYRASILDLLQGSGLSASHLSGTFGGLLAGSLAGNPFAAGFSFGAFEPLVTRLAAALPKPAPTPSVADAAGQAQTPVLSTGMFGYREYSAAKSIDLVQTSFKLAISAQLDKIFGIDVDRVFNSIGAVIPAGVMANALKIEMPVGWSKVGPAALGPGAGPLDFDGNYTFKSPLTGSTYSGPQVQIYEERDTGGHITGLSVAFVGTNSPVDVLDYLQLNSGEIAPNMEPLLNAVRDYALANGVAAEDVIVTGYSLGAAYTNVMARFADTLSGGFFADSSYIAYEVPQIFDGKGRVLNIGYENDVVHRAAGDWASFSAAVAAAPGLVGQDYRLQSSTDNLVLFSDDYASPIWPFAPFALYNIVGGWSAHIAGLVSDGMQRIIDSAFYEFTTRDSLVIVSNLGGLTRDATWVQDIHRPSDRYDHVGDSAFLIGTVFDDRIGGNRGNDYIDGMAGNDIIRTGTGADRVEGGAGRDTLQLQGTMGDWSATKLGDGTLAFFSKTYGLDIASGIEQVSFLETGLLRLPRTYEVTSARLEDLTYSGIFERLDQDVAYQKSQQGTAANDTLTGSFVFALGGNDIVTGTTGADVLHGGTGNDRLNGRTGNDFLYGAEGNDVVEGGGGRDLLNGGLGSDIFVFDRKLAGVVTIEDFRLGDDELDMIAVKNSGFASALEFLSYARETAEGLLFDFNTSSLLVADAKAADVTTDMLLMA